MRRTPAQRRWRRLRRWLKEYQRAIEKFEKDDTDRRYYEGMIEAISTMAQTARELQRDIADPDGDVENGDDAQEDADV